MKNSTKLLMLVSIVLFFGCDKDVQIYNTEVNELNATDLQKLRGSFNLNNFEDPVGEVVDNIQVDWNSYIVKNIDGQPWYEFSILESRPVSFSDTDEIFSEEIDSRIKGYRYTLLGNVSNDVASFTLVKIVSFSHDDDYSYFSLKEKYHHGMVYLYNMRGITDYVMYYQKGKVISNLQNSELNGSTQSFVSKTAPTECYQKVDMTARCDSALECALGGGNNSGGGCGSTAGGYVSVTTYHYTDWYNVRTDGSRDYNGRQDNGTTREYVYVSNTSGGSRSRTSLNYALETSDNRVSYSNTRPSNVEFPATKVLFDITIKKNPCVKEIVKTIGRKDSKLVMVPDILQLSEVSHLSQSILDIFKGNKDYYLYIKIAEAGYGKNASTLSESINGKKTITITLDDDYMRRGSKLAIARTLIHEAVHAYLEYIYFGHPKSELSGLLTKYYKDYGGRAVSQHVFMTQYVEAMANSLAVYDKKILAMQYYRDMAWSGDMLETAAFKALSETEQKRIKEIQKAEGNALTKASKKSKSVQCD